MGRFVSTGDFETGEFLISNQSDTTKLKAIIDRLEVEVLQDLLGKTLYDLFIADLDDVPFPQVPQTQRFIDIYNAFYEDEDIIIRSEGFIKMLQMFIYFEYIRQSDKQSTPVGMVINDFENGISASAVMANLERQYNRAIRSYRAVVDYMLLDTATYPEYDGKGIIRDYLSWL